MSRAKRLVVQRFSAMGDVAMTVPVLLAVTQKYPDVQFLVLTRPQFKPIFSQLSGVEVFSVDLQGKHRGLRGLWRLHKEVMQWRPDAVADLHAVLRTILLNVFWKYRGLSVCSLVKGRRAKRALTTANPNKTISQLKTTHQRYAEVFSRLGLSVELHHRHVLPPPTLSRKVHDFAGPKSEVWIGIAPFAQHQGKIYPPNLMQQVLEKLSQDGVKFFLFGGGDTEARYLQAWEEKLPRVQNTAGKLNMEDQLNLIAHLDLMFSMDSGNGHLAANFGVPVVTFWGLTHPYLGFAPYGQHSQNWIMPNREAFPLIPTSVYGNKVPKGYEKALTSVSADEVAQQIKLQIQSIKRRRNLL